MSIFDKEKAIFLAPLAGYTDRSFRRLAMLNGADASVTEMVSAEGLARESDKTEVLLEKYDESEELIAQLFAPCADPVERCLERLLTHNVTAIDLNCGCPVPKVVKTGAGSALMKDPEKMYEIVKFLKDNTKVPISVKFRLGWDPDTINYLDFAALAVKAGASALTLHARTRSQGYSGTANHEEIKKLKAEFKDENVKIFASGDLFTPEDGVRVFEECLVDGIMYARGAIGNPFIFKQTKDLLEKGSYSPISNEERVKVMTQHLDFMIEDFGLDFATREMRKHACAYIKGLPGASKVKVKIVNAKTRDEYINSLNELV